MQAAAERNPIKTVRANGLEFGYLEAGDGPLALCLHGFPDSAYTWRHLLPELAAAGYHAVAPFLRGYAPTEVPADGAYQTGALVSDAVALHDALGGDDQAVIVGHDWGGFATYGALSYAPERWRRAVTLAVPPPAVMVTAFFDYEQLKRSFYMFVFQTSLAEIAVAADDMAFIDGLWRDWSPGYAAVEDLAHAKDCLREPANLGAAIGYYRAMLDASRHQEAYADAQHAAGRPPARPVLYLHGRDDGCLGADLSTDVGDHLGADSRLIRIDGAGHFLHLERPAQVNRHILDWLAD
ncbi:MAG TPA: alpha/beta hydrolase [Streptosporangiaceae bacterium]|jgi:pimeloyl-ACP methyl ester carboxylesterase